ncbi:hypothetical protein ABMA28_012142 [Loxostege sticticalis]|uniref:Endonuclease n=1 Tax=Loxostege sticticalis TaxID=481309 RepID=A0ABD0TLV2_LOXSC
MEGDLRVLDDLKTQIEKGYVNYKKSPKDRINANYIKARLGILNEQYHNFIEKHERLLETYSTQELESTSYVKSETFEAVFDSFLNYKVELQNALDKFESAPKGSCNVSSDSSKRDSVLKLPKIKLPTFSGKYVEWSSFRDLFISLVHNNASLDNVQKMHYLKTQLSGEAEQLIRHVPITDSNYVKCWNMLKDRYNNKRYISFCILKRLFGQRSITNESSSALKELLDVTTDCLHELSNLGIDVSSWDVIVIYVVSLKLDAESRKQWELQVSNDCNELPTLKQFKEFLCTRFRALEFVEPKTKTKAPSITNSNPKALHTTTNISCPHCSEEHRLYNCKRFASEDVEKRRNIVETLGLCFNCLGYNHSTKVCRVPTKCRICKRKHHSLLHPKTTTAAVATSSETTSTDAVSEAVTNIAAHFSKGVVSQQVLLATALIKADSKNGSSQILRALLDQGSQASFISEAAVQLLQLKKTSTKSTISGIGGGHGGLTSKYTVMLNIQSLCDPSFSIQVRAHVLGTLTSVLPERKFTLVDWPEIRNLQLADPSFNSPNKIDVLLGAEAYCHIIKQGLMKGPKGTPIAQDTYLGWIISGGVEELQINNVIVSMHAQVEANDLLKRIWELEPEPVSLKKRLTKEEQACEEYYAATTQRDESGRYVVHLPFRHDDPPCKYGDSKNIAIKRLHGLEQKFRKQSETRERYSGVINEYLSLGHMEKITDEDERSRPDAVYLPHHAVIKEGRATTKVRVVFDASCKGTNGVSLNDTLMVGPRLQADLRYIVMRWRRHLICLAADVVKMFRQVMIAREHTDYQRIVWRESTQEEIGDYRLLTVTFGTSCAPYLAVKTLQQIACDEGHKYPLAAERIKADVYMDDVLTGCQSETEAIEVYKQLKKLLKEGGFQLQKWTSNSDKLLDVFKEDAGGDVEIKQDQVSKVLGLTWNRTTDRFEYSVKPPLCTAPETKRKVISEISRLFDPMGWIAPCIVTSRVFIQRLWIAGIGWDDELPPELLKEWESYRSELVKLQNFHLPRWINTSTDDTIIELHGFSDASNIAYAAVVYIRVVDSLGNVRTHLITAKTKVAPIKQISIPRLELCGAVLVTHLLVEVAEVLGVPKTNLHAWTDSSVVLAWLSDHPSRWKTFVANRTSEILNLLDNQQWSHVQSKDNPADMASRGIKPTHLLNNLLWLQGPTWLRNDSVNYTRPSAIKHNEEERVVKVHVNAIAHEDEDEWLWDRFSSLRKLVRVVAFCRRFIKRCREPAAKSFSYLSVTELKDSLNLCIQKCQSTWFRDEIRTLQSDGNVSKASSLCSLSPFLDQDGILRVGGRIRHSELPPESKHPIVVPHKSRLAKFLVADAHERTFHGGQQLMLRFLQSRYWILRAKTLIRSHIHHYVPCIRYAGLSRNPLMGELPSCRVTPSKPFSNSGVDFAGPINIRCSKGRGQRSYKGYICLFVCMATRAVHIEAVSDLTSEGFLAAFKRFVARRGHCSHLWSDNGTNFVGASRELRLLFNIEKNQVAREIADALANNHTEWHYIPPRSPNFGGLWEAGIKSVKHHFKRVIGDSTLTFEEISTVLSQIEACLNSRPLCQSSSDPGDEAPLTPGHFLVGQSIVLPPDHNFEQLANISTLRRWQLTQRMVQSFWRRWSAEYLTNFFQRYKWSIRTTEFKVGDVVLIKEDNLPPAKWLYGRIVELHPGKDNVTRVVSVRCKNTVIKRPTSKLCRLPLDDKD